MIGDGFSALLRGARDGDEDAFAALWRETNPSVLRYLRVVVGSAAEDVASETWMRVARDFARFGGEEADFRAWLFTIARHRALDWRRREARRPADLRPPELFADDPAPDDPERAVLERMSTEMALELIGALPPDQAEVVTLRTVAGLDVAAVARLVGKRPGAVRVLSHRGLRKLAELLGDSAQTPRGVTR